MKTFTKRVVAVFLFLILAAAAAVPAVLNARAEESGADDFPLGRLAVTGTASVEAAPSEAHLNFGVTTYNPVPASAVRENAEIMQRAIDALQKQGYSAADLKTVRYNIYPVYDHYDSMRGVKTYSVQNELRVKLNDPKEAGTVIDALTGAGVNTISGIEFRVSENREFYREALKGALKDAREKADMLAKELDKNYGIALVCFEESGSSRGGNDLYSVKYAESGTFVSGGMMNVSVTVHAVFKIVKE